MASEEATGSPGSSNAAGASTIAGLPPAALEGLLNTIRQVVREELAANGATGESASSSSTSASDPPPRSGELVSVRS